jgi:hypothetical protein
MSLTFPLLHIQIFWSSHHEIETMSSFESGIALWLIWPIKCGESDILGSSWSPANMLWACQAVRRGEAKTHNSSCNWVPRQQLYKGVVLMVLPQFGPQMTTNLIVRDDKMLIVWQLAFYYSNRKLKFLVLCTWSWF